MCTYIRVNHLAPVKLEFEREQQGWFVHLLDHLDRDVGDTWRRMPWRGHHWEGQKFVVRTRPKITRQTKHANFPSLAEIGRKRQQPKSESADKSLSSNENQTVTQHNTFNRYRRNR